MSRRVKKYLPVLKRITKLCDKAKKDFVRKCDKEFLDCVSECAKNIIKGNFPSAFVRRQDTFVAETT